MTEELKEVGVDLGRQPVGRVMRETGVVGERARKFKAMTDSDHTSLSAPNLLDRDFTPDRRNQKWAADRPGRQQPHEARSGDPGAEASRDIASQCLAGQ